MKPKDIISPFIFLKIRTLCLSVFVVNAKFGFKGYSGRARALSGTVALIAAVIMASSSFPKVVSDHIYGWGLVFVVGFVLNYGALIHWFLFDLQVKRDLRKLRPTLDAFPALFVGGVLTLALIKIEQVHLLFGMWMCLFGLTSLASRQVLPKMYWVVGLFYISCGTYYLLTPDMSFLNPWPMGVVFFIGEWVGGIILHYDERLNSALNKILKNLFKIKETSYVP
ncbi:MAG: hypothetical protein ACE5HI_14200 [bacterium]